MKTVDREYPETVCLCGSTKFKQDFIKANFAMTMLGKIVLSVGFFGHTDKEQFEVNRLEKAKLDVLHFRKIDLADSILVIDLAADEYKKWLMGSGIKNPEESYPLYIGESTEREIEYAASVGRGLMVWSDIVIDAASGTSEIDIMMNSLIFTKEKK